MITVGLSHPALANSTGRGVAVAVIDSGVHPDHPHVGGVAGGVPIGVTGDGADDYLDRLGHGTAVTAAIREKAPGAEIHVVKVFGSELATTRAVLIESIDWASEHGARLINLSLGTVRSQPELALWACANRARERGSLIVSPRASDGHEWLPGCLDAVLGVELDWACARDQITVARDDDERWVFRASGFPRPIPGVPPERNLKGVSFAAANVTGVLARVLEGWPEVTTLEDVTVLLAELDVGGSDRRG